MRSLQSSRSLHRQSAMLMVVMIMIMMMMVVIIAIRVGVEFLRAHLLVGDLGKFGDVVDHLVLVDRSPELGEQARIIAIEIVDLALLAREFADALHQRPVHLVVGDLDLLTLSDFRKHKPEPDAPRSNVLIFGPSFFLCGALVLEAPFMMLQIVGELAP